MISFFCKKSFKVKENGPRLPTCAQRPGCYYKPRVMSSACILLEEGGWVVDDGTGIEKLLSFSPRLEYLPAFV